MRILVPILVVLYLAPIAGGQLIQNGDFEADAIVGPGQSVVAPGDGKLILINPLEPAYPNAISGIPDWINSLDGAGGRDAGLRRIDFDGSGNTQFAYINNWETRLSQVTSRIVQPGYDYTARILVGFAGDSKAGRFQLWAGVPSATNPDEFPPTAVLLADISAASPGWNQYVPDVSLSNNEWHQLELTYAAPISGPMIGQPLTVSFLTSLSSVGPTFWDNASLLVVPEPNTMVLSVLMMSFSAFCSARFPSPMSLAKASSRV